MPSLTRFITFLILVTACSTYEQPLELERADLVLGQHFDIRGSAMEDLGVSVGMTVSSLDFIDIEDGTIRIRHRGLDLRLISLGAMLPGNGLCEDEPFRDQPSAEMGCTAFAIGEDLVATNAHCLPSGQASCDVANVLFDFSLPIGPDGHITDPDEVTIVPKDNLFKCVELVGSARNANEDWAVMRVAPVVPDAPMPPALELGRRPGFLEPIFAVGHPYGLPTKVSTGRSSVQVFGSHWVFTDIAHGPKGSGSPIFDSDGRVVAIYTHGIHEPVVRDGTCHRFTKCDGSPNSACWGVHQQGSYVLAAYVDPSAADMCTIQDGTEVGHCCEAEDGTPGMCIDSDQVACPGTEFSGACPGGSEIRCCVIPA